jgi:hypothetical protein
MGQKNYVDNKYFSFNHYLQNFEYKNGSESFKSFILNYNDLVKHYNDFDMNKFVNKSFNRNKDETLEKSIGKVQSLYHTNGVLDVSMDTFYMSIDRNDAYYHLSIYEVDNSMIFDYIIDGNSLLFIVKEQVYQLSKKAGNLVFKSSSAFDSKEFENETYSLGNNSFLFYSGYVGENQKEYKINRLEDLGMTYSLGLLIYNEKEYIPSILDNQGYVIYQVLEEEFFYSLIDFDLKDLVLDD